MNEHEASCFIEALIFSAEEPLAKESMKKMLVDYGNFDLDKILDQLKKSYNNRGIQLIELDKKFFFRTSINLQNFL